MAFPRAVRGVISFTLLALNTLVCATALLPLSLIKLIVPVDAARKRVDPLLNRIAESWIANNGVWIELWHEMNWRVEGAEGLRRGGWYLVEANHQSWADVFVLQKVLNRRIPMLKFFLKRALIRVPVIGLAWWALDFPFVRRHSAEYLRKHPGKRGADLAEIRRACEKFSLIPTSVMSFLEGTRFTAEKRASENSPYAHLLRPRAGGIALVLNAMGEKFESLLDVTLFYPGGVPTFFEFLAGRTSEVVVAIRGLPIPQNLIGGDYQSDPEYRARIQAWLDELWREKDRKLEAFCAASDRASRDES